MKNPNDDTDWQCVCYGAAMGLIAYGELWVVRHAPVWLAMLVLMLVVGMANVAFQAARALTWEQEERLRMAAREHARIAVALEQAEAAAWHAQHDAEDRA